MMTVDERMAALRALDAILRDNTGNRLTHALISGIVNTLHDNIPATVAMPPQDEDQPSKGVSS